MSYEDHDQGDDDRHRYDDPGAVGAARRCTEPDVLGSPCDEPADMRCPLCVRALCFSCAAEHCGACDAPRKQPPSRQQP